MRGAKADISKLVRPEEFCPQISVIPPRGNPSVKRSVSGSNTRWVQGTTTASFVEQPLCPVVIVNKITISS